MGRGGRTGARTFRSGTRLTARVLPAFSNELPLAHRATHALRHAALLVIRMKRFALNQSLLHGMVNGRPSC